VGRKVTRPTLCLLSPGDPSRERLPVWLTGGRDDRELHVAGDDGTYILFN
jgi:hypothetical protein